jgi:hypothetical protein
MEKPAGCPTFRGIRNVGIGNSTPRKARYSIQRREIYSDLRYTTRSRFSWSVSPNLKKLS